MRAALLALGVALGTAGGILLFDGKTGLFPLLGLIEDVRAAEARVTAGEGERRRLIREIRALRTDPLAVEAVAREKLGMVRPGEIVVRLRRGAPEAD